MSLRPMLSLPTTSMKRTLTVAIASAALLTAAHASAQTLRFAHVDPDDWTTSKKGAAGQVFKNLVEAETDLTVELYPAGALGGETELIEGAQDGTISIAMVSGAYANFCPAVAVTDIPYTFPSAPVAWEVMDGEFGTALAEHCLEQTGLRTLAYGETGFRHFTNSVRPIHTPEDMQGLKFRVQTIPLYLEMVSALGGVPQGIAWGEVPTALATGVVDGQENPISVIYGNNFYEFQDYLTLDRHVYGVDHILINDEIFQSLSEEEQAAVKRAAVVAGTTGRAIQQFNSAEGITKLQAEGMEITQPTAEQMDAFREAAQPPVQAYLRNELGDEAEWIDRLAAAVDDASSRF
ncbi:MULTISPECIES: DctP family TRAP transporter solute-binding subunit [Halomonadaceae]|uniref:DctP family TRAP transporter solute-binding subunit n=1 Tax=Vreelandella piezotolerans TaxID=2609667 RepID=A0ABQ6X7C1_9GAMM|nr:MULTISPECIES: DctP family TRAP transporter solute-binding subunit [Halomonas]KAE8437901.1 DctP family TRAP transporter solute-binding subunit [Halomonas piezotolerans]MCG7576280.1 DctP family TRAP transporter solute-binding subunit [Halomonas sp. MMH1-48]MCG7603343.1 DctP family TRAP transporter solute-binding subunit [Halomonas sp. MM17-34]MCG7612593.1 DctP family TRAP transporter solute-binding subunit [Halomonas sp. MM17-29]MCG7619841.1 DctP family TRAP transporter solute-binding subunit